MRIIKGRVRVAAPDWPQFEKGGIAPEVLRALANLHVELVRATLEESDERAALYSMFGKVILEATDTLDDTLKNAK